MMLMLMSLGATPLQAIECAAKFDPDTGHPIDVMTLKRLITPKFSSKVILVLKINI